MKKILIIDCLTDDTDTFFYRCSNGLASVLNVINKKGIEIKVLRGHCNDKLFLKNLVKYLIKHKFNYIALSILSYPTYDLTGIFKIIRNTKSIIFVGGLGVTIYQTEILKYSAYWDYVFIGESETPLSMFFDNVDTPNIPNIIYKNKGRVISNGIKYLASTDEIDVFLAPLQIYIDTSKVTGVAEVICSRGCIYNCTYCSNGKQRKMCYENHIIDAPYKYRRQVSVDTALNIIEKYYSAGYKNLDISDDIFYSNIEWFCEFLQKYKQKFNRNDIYSFYTTIPFINEDFFKAIIENDIYITVLRFGFECGNEQIRSEILKRPPYSNLDFSIAIQKIKDCNHIQSYRVSNMYALPCETIEDMYYTLYQMAINLVMCYTMSIFVPIPNTELYDYCVENNMLDSNIISMSIENKSLLFNQKFTNFDLIKFDTIRTMLTTYYISDEHKKLLSTIYNKYIKLEASKYLDENIVKSFENDYLLAIKILCQNKLDYYARNMNTSTTLLYQYSNDYQVFPHFNRISNTNRVHEIMYKEQFLS